MSLWRMLISPENNKYLGYLFLVRKVEVVTNGFRIAQYEFNFEKSYVMHILYNSFQKY